VRGPDFALVGPGRLGFRLLLRLLERGYRCAAVVARRPLAKDRRALLPPATVPATWDPPSTWSTPGLLFICVPDPAVATVAAELARRLDLTGATVLHTSGLLTAEALAPCRAVGARVASWHPLQSFGPLDPAWDGVACAVEGDPEAVAVGFTVARDLGLRPWPIRPADKALYHAAAAVAANLTHVLVAAACDLLERCGLPATPADHPLRPLVETSLRAALTTPGLEGLTGPLARGDLDSVARHLEALPPALADAYRAVVAVAEELRGRPRGPS
jgi:predicted short-subunit dehydrogenase-like oxidoreductase (DUF2520 family)